MATGALPQPGDVIDRYEVIAEVARGGMAAVFAARRKSIGGFDKILAIKILLPNVSQERQAVKRFLDEARIASRISHPNVVAVIDVNEHEGLPYLLMEFLRGQSLAQVSLAAKIKGRPLPVGFRLAVLARAAEGLAAAHATLGSDGNPLGVVHRDVSPQNIHVGYSGEVKVVDFGIAAARGRLAETTTGEFRGKLAYAAPEQLTRSQRTDARADIWALAVIGWELLTERRLFRGEDERETMFNILERPIANLAEILPRVPEDASRTIMRCLERDPSARLADAAVLSRALDDAALEVGGGRREDVAAFMNDLLATERSAENKRLAVAARGDAQPSPSQRGAAAANSLTGLSGDPDRERRSRAPLVASVAAVAVIAASVAALSHFHVLASNDTVPSNTPAPTARSVVHITVPVGLAVALVDGQRHDERPLAIPLSSAQTAAVELIATDGRTLQRTVSSADDGRRLELPAPARPPAAPVPSARRFPRKAPPPDHAHPRAAEKTSATGPLLGDPY